MRRMLILVGLLIFATASVLIALRQRDHFAQDIRLLSEKLPELRVPVPSPVPFEELTIPYLRNRVYESQLGPQQKVSQNSQYTTFLTSYQSDGLKINGLLTIPAGTPPEGGWPAIVFIHGYIPPTLYRTQERYVSYVNYLARNKFVVFKIDLRGFGESQGQPGGAYYSSDYIIDTLNAYAALQSTPFVNRDHIGLWGHSMAGNIVLRTVAAKPTIPAAVIWAGAGYTYIDLQTYRIQDPSYRPPSQTAQRNEQRQRLFDQQGDFTPTSEFWKQVAPTNYVQDFKGAIQLHHALDDAVVSINYTRDLKKILDNTQVPHEVYEYPRGGHNIEGASFNLAMERTVRFFTTYLR
jgi:dipeptidyl aminopeptidase/acylaminoacyl peptidase